MNNSMILLVDDEEAIRDIIGPFLIDEGYCVVCAENGEDALKMVKVNDFSLIISDVFMPKMDGVDFIVEVRSIKKDIPFIAISGDTEEGLTSSLRTINKYGKIPVLKKPFNMEELLKMVKENIN